MGTIFRRYICSACKHSTRSEIEACPKCGCANIYRSAWQIFYMAGGKRIQKAFPGRTKGEVERILKRLEGEAAAGEYGMAPVTRLTLGRYIEEKWWPLHGSRLRSARNYRYNLDRHVLPRFGSTGLHRVTEADVVAWRNELIDSKLSPAAVNRLVYLVSSIYTRAVRWRDTKHHPVRDLEPLPEHNERGADKRLTWEQYQSLLGQVDRMEWEETTRTGMKAAITLAIHTCLRKQNLFGLRWDQHVDMAARTITIPGDESKNQTAVVLPINDTTYEVLASLPRDLRSQFVLAGSHGRRLVKAHQNHWAELRKAMRKRDRSFPNDLHWHDLRATGASWLIAAGVPERVVMRLMNLKSTRVLSRYDRQAQDQLLEASKKLDQLGDHSTPTLHRKGGAS